MAEIGNRETYFNRLLNLGKLNLKTSFEMRLMANNITWKLLPADKEINKTNDEVFIKGEDFVTEMENIFRGLSHNLSEIYDELNRLNNELPLQVKDSKTYSSNQNDKMKITFL